jgi:hypothetical protein
MILTFGKYKGKSIESLYVNDKDYLIWLATTSYIGRKEAQLVYKKELKKEASKPKDYKILHQSYDNDLNWDVVIKINNENYTIKFTKKVDFDFKVCLEYKTMIFTNKYDKKNKWVGATLNNYKPTVKIL